jgi:hypothetical protein
MNWVEDRMRGLERRVEDLLRLVQDTILPQLRGTQQGIQGLYQQPSSTTSGTTGGFECVCPGGGIAAASGNPGTGAPSSGTANIYQIQSGSYVLMVSGGTVYNSMPNACTAGYVLNLVPNGDGTYLAVSQACQSF